MDDQEKQGQPTRRVRAVPADPGRSPQGPRDYPPPPPQRDFFPYVMGGLVSAGLLGLLLIVWLVVSPNRGAVPTVSPTRTPVTGAPVEFPTAPVPLGVQTGLPGEVPTNDIAIPPAVPTGSPPPADDPPRMQLGDFKALYDDPAARPIIIDTRNEAAFAEGHIPGAILFPSTEVENNVATLPKDKLIVAYCQWPAEHSSASVARELKESYGFTYDNVKVLLGGWDAWLTKNVQDPNGYPIATGNE